jgi:hypothetical protein
MKGLLRIGRYGILFIVVMTAFGCASSSRYRQPIDTFNVSMKSTKDLLTAYLDYTALTEVRKELELKASVRSPDRIDYIKSTECTAGGDAEDCKIEELPDPELLQLGHQAKGLLGDMVQYTEGLVELVEADTEEAFNESVRSLTGEMNQIKVNGKSLGGTFAQVVEEAADLAFDRRRTRILQNAVTAADEYISEAGDTLKFQLSLAYQESIDNQRAKINEMIDDYNATRKKAGEVDRRLALFAMFEELQKLRQMIRNDPREVIDKMVIAHHALSRSLNDDNPLSGMMPVAEIESFRMAAAKTYVLY